MDLSHLCEIGLNIAGGAPRLASVAGGKPPSTAASSGRPVVTRFAPSPTGYLHIGGARTALFSYMYAKKHGGQFKLRIEDTDAERNDESAVEAIVKGLNWLGVQHDGAIVRQSRNIKRHQEVVKKLLAEGHAYKCYCTKEELDAMRAEADAKKVAFRYPGTYRDVGPDFKPPAGREFVVRIKTPNDEGVTAWEDGVMGHIEFPNKDLDDFVIARADGSPTYLLAVVVDDYDMGITHVMRGSDHISNTPRQMAIWNNCGWELPQFAHFPLIHGPDGKKMSKRHGATGAEQYEALGYLPEAMRNYLARLSWAHGDDEIFTTEQAIQWFSFEGCSKGAPCFDFDKLAAVNQHYIKECDIDRITDLLEKFHPDVKPFSKKLRLQRIAEMLKVRSKTIVEYREAADFIVAKRPIGILAAAAKNMTSDAAKGTLRDMADLLRKYDGEWSPEGLETCIKALAESKGLKMGDLAKPSRAALTGSTNSPGLFEVIWAVGKEECIGRFEDAVNGLCPVKEPPAPKTPAQPTETTETAPAAVPTPVPIVPSGDLDAQVKAVGDEIRELKVKLKASGLSGKAIDKTAEVQALVAKLSELKAAQATGPAPVAASAAVASAPAPAAAISGDVDAQVKAVGDQIRELKAKLKADGLSGKAIDKTEEVKALVAKLTELKAALPK
mmetsp:Transcript_61410/g.132047  ORF Transcript_61410/g.132047 Transcript_61410/m.132047 type:complete len:668 (+) Transcript_61410:139-2142(+)